MVIISIAGIIIVVLAVAIGVAVAGKGKGDSPQMPTDAPTMAPTNVLLDPVKIQAFEDYLVVHKGMINSSSIFDQDSSPQQKAYQWLLTFDEVTQFSADMTDDQVEVMKTRYILAVFYYALQGDKWFKSNGWLGSDLNHCEWEFISCDGSLVIGIKTKVQLGGQPEAGNNNMKGPLPAELMYLPFLGRCT
jgi:hypothetical protein